MVISDNSLAISNNNPDLLESIIIPPASSRQAALRPTATEAKKVESLEQIQSPPELDNSEDMSTFDEASSPSALGRRPSLKRKRPHEDQEDENVVSNLHSWIGSVFKHHIRTLDIPM